jgi:oligopeptide transport system ATP-binding protein
MVPLLEVKDLTKRFRKRGRGELTAVDRISFCLYPGETLGIVGGSGSGKSTVARLAARLIDASEGEIRLKGRDITRLAGKELRRACRCLQMVFQTPVGSFDPRRTLGDGIGESLKNAGVPAGERKKRVAALLGQCGLSGEYADRYPHEVSGGQCQRAALARALAVEPELLICDEITSALDVTVQKQILELLEELREKKKMTFLFISHDLALVQRFCSRILVMEDGKVAESGTPEEVILHPKAEYTKRLVEAAGFFS